MKKRKWLLVFVIISFVCGLSYLVWPFPHKKKLFFQIPVQFMEPGIPCINVKIEGIKLPCELDTGADHYLSLKKEMIDQIKNKKPNIGTRTSRDVKGNKYVVPIAEIDLVEIERISFKNAPVVEESLPFLLEGSILDPPICKKLEKGVMAISGRVGLAFLKSNDYWLIDLPNASIYAIRDLKAFEKATNVHLTDLVETSLEWAHGLLVMPVQTDLGVKKLVLDTGASHTMIRCAEPGCLSLKTREFKIGECDFGERSFKGYPLDPFFKVDGFLGRDFFQEHAIYLDLRQMKAFIARQKQQPLPAVGY